MMSLVGYGSSDNSDEEAISNQNTISENGESKDNITNSLYPLPQSTSIFKSLQICAAPEVVSSVSVTCITNLKFTLERINITGQELD